MAAEPFETSWHGFHAWALESDTLRAVVVPELGGKLASLFDKRARCEWLIGPESRPLVPAPYGANLVEYDISGWDEMFPTIIACDHPGPGTLHGVALPDHGEVWTLPWTVDRSEPGGLLLSVQGRALPYTLTRRAVLDEPAMLRLQYTVTNTGDEAFPYLWAAHPHYRCAPGTEVVLPPEVSEVINTQETPQWGAEGRRFSWPEATAADGVRRRPGRIGSPALHHYRKFYVPPEIPIGWAALLEPASGVWVRMEWPPASVPYLGIWIEEGVYHDEPSVALEPATAFYDTLSLAWDAGRVSMLEPHETQGWELRLQVGNDGDPTPSRPTINNQ